MNETPGMPENVEASRTRLPPDFFKTLELVRGMVNLSVHQKLDHWRTKNHSLAPDTGGGD